MTGTADTESEEFHNIYKLDVVVIPTNMPMVRRNNPDLIFKTEREKFDAIVEEIVELFQLDKQMSGRADLGRGAAERHVVQNCFRGSKASRRPSPRKLRAKRVSDSVIAGKINCHE